jgi:hypothetical protein
MIQMIPVIQTIQTIQMRVTRCTMPSGQGARGAAAFILRHMSRLRASGDTLCGLNYPHRRAMLVLLFSEIPSDMHPLVAWLRGMTGAWCA